jgi:hypothetical protein
VKNWIGLVGALVVLVLLVLGGKAWLEQHDAILRAELELKVLRYERNEAMVREAEAVAQIEELKKIKDPQVIVREVPKYIPFHVESRPSGLPGVSADGGGEAPPELVIPPGELPVFWTYVQECRECEVKLAARDADVVNLQKQIAVVEKSKKNTFWNKAKYFVIGGAMGAAAGYAASR